MPCPDTCTYCTQCIQFSVVNQLIQIAWPDLCHRTKCVGINEFGLQRCHYSFHTAQRTCSRIAILSGFQLVWSSELMVNLTFYIVVAMRDCEIWQFPVWSSFTYYKSTRKKRAEYERKISFFNGEQSVMYKKRIHTLWNMNTKNKTKSMFCLKMYSASVFQDE